MNERHDEGVLAGFFGTDVLQLVGNPSSQLSNLLVKFSHGVALALSA
jgi:hypothetical protein